MTKSCSKTHYETAAHKKNNKQVKNAEIIEENWT